MIHNVMNNFDVLASESAHILNFMDFWLQTAEIAYILRLNVCVSVY